MGKKCDLRQINVASKQILGETVWLALWGVVDWDIYKVWENWVEIPAPLQLWIDLKQIIYPHLSFIFYTMGFLLWLLWGLHNKLTCMAQNKYSVSSLLSLSFYILSPRIPLPKIPISNTGHEAVSSAVIPGFPIQGWLAKRDLSGCLRECSTIYMGREGMMKTWVCRKPAKVAENQD